MAPILGKRPHNDHKHKVGKRQRIDPRRVTARSKSASRTVAVDSLPWKEAALSDRFEDAEGFFGLEEIDDVEVVREASSGKVEFRAIPKSLSNTTASPPGRKTSANGVDEEWTGFEESDNDGQPITADTKAIRTPQQKAKSKESEEIKDKKVAKTNVVANEDEGDKGLGDATFESLYNQVEEETDVSAWNPLELSSQTTSSLARLGFAKPTPIQKAAIPEILNGHDVVGKASTGSGKTLAFGIPILEYYLETCGGRSSTKIAEGETREPPIALILSPTRELAHQLSTHLTDLCSHLDSNGPRIATLTGGLSVHKQQRLLRDADIIIGTPGRLWEVISGSTGIIESLKQIRYLVVDEADRLLNEGHFKEVELILDALDREVEGENDEHAGEEAPEVPKSKRQTLVFSATFQKDLQQKLAGKGKHPGGDIMGKQESMEYLLKKLNFREERPKFIDVNPVSQMAVGLKEGIVECAGMEKDLYLYALLLHHPNTRTLIFTNSITSVRRLTSLLQTLNIPAHALHSQMPQKARLRSIERFSSPSTPSSILIATDVAARGLDIPSVQLILHYHVPRAADMYVHRSGRTARAEKSGSSILLCAPEEVQGVRRLVAKVHARNAATASSSNGNKFYMRTIELDRRVVARLKTRITLAKKISDAALAKEKKGHEDNWLKTAAEDLGVDYDSEEFAANEGSKKGRGAGRKKAEREARGLTKAEVGALRAELREMLGRRVNVGVSERYLSAGGVDVEELLEGREGEFLGSVGGGVEML